MPPMRLVHTAPFPSHCPFLSKHLPNPTAAATPPLPEWRGGGVVLWNPPSLVFSPHPPDVLYSALTIQVSTVKWPTGPQAFYFCLLLDLAKDKSGRFLWSWGKNSKQKWKTQEHFAVKNQDLPICVQTTLIHQKVMLVLAWPHHRAMVLHGAHCMEGTSLPHIAAGHGMHQKPKTKQKAGPRLEHWM